MKHAKKIIEWKKKLESQGFEVETPLMYSKYNGDFHAIRDVEGNLEEFERYKRIATKKHFQKIKESDILLVLNYDKNGIKNYIGGNTFAEIAYAYGLNICHNKNIEIYTVNPLPEDLPYSEELKAWKIRQWEGE